IAAGAVAADVVDITAPATENIRRVAKAKGGSVEDVTVCILDRPRHETLVKEVREAGARIKFITDGDVAGAIMAAREQTTDGDLLRGVRYSSGGASTQSLVMRSKSGTIRQIESWHRLTKLRAYSSIDFERPRSK